MPSALAATAASFANGVGSAGITPMSERSGTLQQLQTRLDESLERVRDIVVNEGETGDQPWQRQQELVERSLEDLQQQPGAVAPPTDAVARTYGGS